MHYDVHVYVSVRTCMYASVCFCLSSCIGVSGIYSIFLLCLCAYACGRVHNIRGVDLWSSPDGWFRDGEGELMDHESSLRK